MATTFTSTLTVTSNVYERGTHELSTINVENKYSYSFPLAAGSGASQINAASEDTGTIAPAGSVNFDLDGGTVEDLYGNAVTYATVRKLIVKNLGAANALTLSGDFLGIGAEAITIEPGAMLLKTFGTTGKAVVATTGDVITIGSTGGTDYDIVIEGTHA